MKTIKIFTLLLATGLFTAGCNNTEKEHEQDTAAHHDHDDHGEEVHFTAQQYQTLAMKVGNLPLRNISAYVEVNGQLEVPPQNEAAVTAIVGANVTKIMVIEGEKIKKGQALAYLSHPDLIKVQTDYVNSWSQLKYQEESYKRQQKMREENIGSGKEFQKVQADYLTTKAMTNGYEAQLSLMGLDIQQIREGDIYEEVPVISPISGYVRLVEVKMGQYVQPQKELFEIVNIDHIHADFMVFEKDMHKVKEGQKVYFTSESIPGKEMTAIIHSVGKSFEQDPKAIHLHAEIENKEGLLIPGMYVRGRIMTDEVESYALPESGVMREGDKHFIFTAKKSKHHGETEWTFTPIEVIAGKKQDGWVEVKLLKELPEGTLVARNNAYYLMADMNKESVEHSH